MEPEQRDELLRALAGQIERAGLALPAQMLLDIGAPFAVVMGQLALFTQPFVPDERWRSYARLLEDSASWQELRALLQQQDY